MDERDYQVKMARILRELGTEAVTGRASYPRFSRKKGPTVDFPLQIAPDDFVRPAPMITQPRSIDRTLDPGDDDYVRLMRQARNL